MGDAEFYRDYYPFGQDRVASTTDETAYQFTGKEKDSNSGLIYFGARYYDPEVGRFIGVDPLADKYPSLSPYCYAANNPLKFIDPDGEAPFDIVNNAIKAKYDELWNYGYNLNLKYTPAIYDYASTITGLMSYGNPFMAVISFELKAGAIAMKVDNPYYPQVEDIIGDVAGLIVSLVDPVTGEIVNMTIDNAYKLGYLTENDIKKIRESNHHINNNELTAEEQKNKNENEDDNENNNDNNDDNNNNAWWDKYDPSKQ